ncbi:PAS domain S-box protein [Conexibacter sp. SYSU D00693]|uniref:sensor domain-containing protein n=1 Tax=Conexibacter sp. SYSU D00693 TaxID=2812560 RepID=UPI00196B09CF|nr:PAS domain S-box protein [Conexibacter sp. SYSU D00693]
MPGSVSPIARVLVADQGHGLSRLVHARLQQAGAYVDVREGVEVVLTTLRDGAFDLVLLDLPDDAFESLDALHRVTAAAPGVDVLAVGDLDGDAVLEALRAGAVDVLPRDAALPGTIGALVAALVARRQAVQVGRGGAFAWSSPWRRAALAGTLLALFGATLLATEGRFALAALCAVAIALVAGALRHAELRAAVSEATGRVAVAQVQASQRRQRMLATLAPVGIIETDASGSCTYVNPRWCELTGLRPRDAWDDGWVQALDPADRETAFSAWARAIAMGRELQLELRLRHTDGTTTWASLASTPMVDAEGELVGHLGTVTDITRLKEAERASDEARLRLESMVEHWPASAWLQDLDGTFLMANSAAAHALGASPDGIVGRPVREVLSPHAIDASLERDEAVLAGEVVRFEPTIVNADGEERHHLATKFPVRDADGRVIALGGLSVDITERMRVEAALRDEEERFRHAFEDAPVGMLLADLDGSVLQVNPAFCALTGYSAEQLLETSLQSLVHPDDVEEDVAAITALLQGRLATHHHEERLLHAAGEPVWVSLHLTLVKAADGSPRHLLAQVLDVTERKRFEGRLQHMADHDPLTGLLNRRRFEEELDRQVAKVQRYGSSGALLVLDLDHFKTINDTLGHNAGDELIVSVADLLRHRLRETDVVARLGGDEFAVLLPEADRGGAETVATTIVEEIRRHATVLNGERPRRVTCSLGVAFFEEGLAAGEEVLVNADLAMYDAKEAGRDQFAIFASDRFAEPRMKARVAWVERIRDALEDDRFVLEAQPIKDLHSGDVAQYELLLRMLDEHGEVVPPGAFLYVAERYDLIQDIDRWVASRAIELLHQHPGTVFEVNVSGKSLNDQLLLETVETGLQISGVDPTRLIFEVTETAAVANIHQAREFADRLASLGCRFALDDFGAGFGSFYYLKHLPFDYLKIDGEFVRNCLRSRTDQLVIEAVVRIANGLGKATIAEFVGDERTERFLRAHGVDHAQGFHVGKPAPLESLLGQRAA